MAVAFKFQYQGQQKEFNYFEGKEVLSGDRNVIVTISGKNEDEVCQACLLFIEKMGEFGVKGWNGFDEGTADRSQTSYWLTVEDKADADWVKAQYKLAKDETLAELKAR